MLKVLLLPLKIVLPFKSYFSPFLIGMAKRLLLGSESIKLCWKKIHMLLDSNQPVKLLILDVSKLVNPFKDDEAWLLLP